MFTRKHYESCKKKKNHVREKLNILKQRMEIEDKERTALIQRGTMENKT